MTNVYYPLCCFAGEWNGKRKKLKKLFQRAIKRLPEDELKNKLNTELPKYLKTLEE